MRFPFFQIISQNKDFSESKGSKIGIQTNQNECTLKAAIK